MAWIAGVDGCKGGWIAVYEDTDSGKLDCRVAVCSGKGKHANCDPSWALKAIMDHHSLDVVAVDMPIGLRDKGKRDCDDAAREALRPLRHSSIFSAPAAAVSDLHREMTYKAASGLNNDLTGKSLSKQSWNLVPKIAEIRGYLEDHPATCRCVHEVHPEVSFAAMNHDEHGGEHPPFSPMQFYKATAGGSIERRGLLEKVFREPFKELEARMPALVGKRAGLDDFYDAMACLWTAQRIRKGPEGPARALCGIDNTRKLDVRKLSESAPCDANGLPMRIVY